MYELKLLYAEDDPKIRAQYVKLFQTMFKNVIECSDGEEAMEFYEYSKPDIMVLDINMPKISGLEVAKKIREKDNTTKVIILTSYSDKEKLLEAIPLNLIDYLIKPVKLSQLKMSFDKCHKELFSTKEDIVNINENIDYNINESILSDKKINIKLTKNEKKLIEVFIKHDFQTLSTETLFEEVWEDYNYSLTKLRSLINRLNAKLTNKLIISDYGVGYKIDLALKNL